MKLMGRTSSYQTGHLPKKILASYMVLAEICHLLGTILAARRAAADNR